MRALLAVLAIVVCGEVFAADPPAKKEEPYVLLEFARVQAEQEWTTTFELTTVSGATYELAIDFGGKQSTLHERTATKTLLAANWMAWTSADNSVVIIGVRNKDGSADRVKTLTITNKLRNGMGQLPTPTAHNGAEVDVRTDDGKAKPDPKRKVPPKGPEFRTETFVEFDFSTLPTGVQDVKWEMTLEVFTTAGKEKPQMRNRIITDSTASIEQIIKGFAFVAQGTAFKAEVIEKTKFRVYGGIRDGRYYPVEKGIITSPHLKPEQLPKITNPKRS